jgi:hypothetical protein
MHCHIWLLTVTNWLPVAALACSTAYAFVVEYNCAAGNYISNGPGGLPVICTPCNVGTYAPYGAGTCTACLSGTFAASTGASSCASCTAIIGCTACTTSGVCTQRTCGAGYYSSNGAPCVACAAGQYSAAGASSCTNCNAGGNNQYFMKLNTNYYCHYHHYYVVQCRLDCEIMNIGNPNYRYK